MRSPLAFRPRVLCLEDRLAPAVLSDNISAASDTTQTETASGARYLTSSFGTDSNAYSLTSVVLKLAQTTAGAAAVDIYTNDSLQPGALVSTLTSPASYSATAAATTFTAAGVSLAANSTYWVVLRAPTGAFAWSYTSDGNNTGTGVGYQNTYGESDDSGSTWFTLDVNPTLMTVNADVAGASGPGAVAFTAAAFTVAENGGTASVTLTRTGGSTGAITIPISVSGGTATAGMDYAAPATPVAFAAGATTATVTFAVTDDALVEGSETVVLALGTPTGGATLGAQATTTVTIADNDAATGNAGTVSFASAAQTVSEAAGTVGITLTRTGGTTGAITVPVTVSGGTATGGADFTLASGTVSFADGQSTVTVSLTIVNDALVEGSETVVLALGTPTGGAALVEPAVTTVAIADDDAATTGPGVVAFSTAAQTVSEGAGTVTVTLVRTGGSAGAVTVPVTVSGGTAAAGSDYTAPAGSVAFAAGQTTATLTIAITDDAAVEPSETIILSLGAPTGGATAGGPATTTVTVADNDTSAAAGTVAFQSATVEASEGAGSVTITLVRTGGSTGSVSVSVVATGGTATFTDDYADLPRSVTFADGQTTATATFTLADDSKVEGAETINLALSGVTGGAAIGSPGTAVFTITDNDSAGGGTKPRVRTTAAGAGTGSGVVVVYDAAGVELRRFQAFEDSFTGGVRVATADVNGDGVDDVVAGAGPGGASVVKIYDGATGSLFAIFTAFEAAYTGGVYVAANDLTGDGSAEVVVTPDLSGGPVVVVYNGAKLAAGANADAQLIRFYGIEDPDFRGGCRAAVGDLNADGRADLAVAAGFSGGPRVALFDGRSVANVAPVKLVPDFFAFEPGLRNGAFVSVGEGSQDIAFGGGPGGGPRVRVFDANVLIAAAPFENVDAVPQAQLANFFAGDPDLRGGARVVLADANNDGAADLQVGSGTGEPARVRVYLSGNTLANADPAPDREVDPFGLTLAGGVYVG